MILLILLQFILLALPLLMDALIPLNMDRHTLIAVAVVRVIVNLENSIVKHLKQDVEHNVPAHNKRPVVLMMVQQCLMGLQ